MTGARQIIAVMIAFRKYNENPVERRLGAYLSDGGKTRYAFVVRPSLLLRWLVVVCRRFRTAYQFHLQGSDSSAVEDGIDRLSRNVGKQLPTHAA